MDYMRTCESVSQTYENPKSPSTISKSGTDSENTDVSYEELFVNRNTISESQNGRTCNWRIVAIVVVVVAVLLVGAVVAVSVVFTQNSKKDAVNTTQVANSPNPVTSRLPPDTTPTLTPSTPTGGIPCSPECDPTHGCGTENDPTNCGRCRRAQVKAGVHTFCVSSCEDVGSTFKEKDMGIDICEELSQENIALPSLGTTCDASSEFPGDWGCENAMDGGEAQWSPSADGAGVWIQFNFDKEYLVAGIEIRSRTAIFSQCTTYDISFDGRVGHRISWECVDRQDLKDYFFQPMKIRSLRITCKVDCGVGGAQGFREIQIWVLKQ